MAKIIAYTRTSPTPVGVEADLFTDTDNGDRCIMVRTFEGVHGQPVPLDDIESEKLANHLLGLVERLRELDRS